MRIWQQIDNFAVFILGVPVSVKGHLVQYNVFEVFSIRNQNVFPPE